MTNESPKSLDVFGIRPVADAFSHLTKASIDGASAFLGRICLPVAEEFGFLLQDKVRAWRNANTVAVVVEAEKKLRLNQPNEQLCAHPRLVASVIENGSWSDDIELHKMWGGLLASSCSHDGRDETNLIFTNLLSQLTSSQVRVLNFACENTAKSINSSGLIMPKNELLVDINTLATVAGTNDIHRLDIELDRLRSMELITTGFTHTDHKADITATPLAINMYVRCQGFSGSAIDFYHLSVDGAASQKSS